MAPAGRAPAMERNAIFQALVSCQPDPTPPEIVIGPGNLPQATSLKMVGLDPIEQLT